MLTTRRLLLRPLEGVDFDALLALHAEPDVARFMPVPRDADEARRRLELSDAQWQERGYGTLAILLRDTGLFIGRTGLRFRPEFHEAHIGWALRRESRGHGYAAEAVAACLEWAFADLRLSCVAAAIHPGNLASIMLAERLDFVRDRDDMVRGERVTVYRRYRDQGGQT